MHAARCAASRDHSAGEFRLHHLAFMVGLVAGRRADAARTARTVAAAAQRAGATQAALRWRDRADMLDVPNRTLPDRHGCGGGSE
jgi:hypothetical protein